MGGSHGLDPVLPAVVLVTQLLPIGFFKVSFVAACIVVFDLLQVLYIFTSCPACHVPLSSEISDY